MAALTGKKTEGTRRQIDVKLKKQCPNSPSLIGQLKSLRLFLFSMRLPNNLWIFAPEPPSSRTFQEMTME